MTVQSPQSVTLPLSSIYSVDMQQQLMTIIDELGKASAKVLGTTLGTVDKGGLSPLEGICKMSLSLTGPASSCTHHQCL